MDSLRLVKFGHFLLSLSIIFIQTYCDTVTDSTNSDIWESIEISSDFQHGIPNLSKVTSTSTEVPIKINLNVDQKDKADLSKQLLGVNGKTSDQLNIYDGISEWDSVIIPDPVAVRSLLKPRDEKDYSISQSFMEGKPENHLVKSTKISEVKKGPIHKVNVTKHDTVVQFSNHKPSNSSKSNLIKFNQKDGIGKPLKKSSIVKSAMILGSNKRQSDGKLDKLKLKMNGPIRRSSDASISTTLIKGKVDEMKKKFNQIKRTSFANRRMITGTPRLISQESYLSPTAQFSPIQSVSTRPTNQILQANQVSLTPSISYLSPVPSIQFSPSAQITPTNFNTPPLSGLTLLQNKGSLQLNQIPSVSASPVNLVPMTGIQQISSLAAPGIQTIVQTPILSSPQSATTFQSSIQSPIQSPIQSASPVFQITPAIQSSGVQTFPVIQNTVPISLIPSQVSSASPLKVTKTQQFESHVVNSPIALSSPTISSAPLTPSLGSPLRSGFIRTPIGLRSQIQRATSYFSPSLPTRSQTVYTQTQMVPTHTTVYTTTQFSPATRTTVYETDHIPIYASTATELGVATKTSSKYGSSISSLTKYGTSFY